MHCTDLIFVHIFLAHSISCSWIIITSRNWSSLHWERYFLRGKSKHRNIYSFLFIRLRGHLNWHFNFPFPCILRQQTALLCAYVSCDFSICTKCCIWEIQWSGWMRTSVNCQVHPTKNDKKTRKWDQGEKHQINNVRVKCVEKEDASSKQGKWQTIPGRILSDSVILLNAKKLPAKMTTKKGRWKKFGVCFISPSHLLHTQKSS